jgi:hypothetical protein
VTDLPAAPTVDGDYILRVVSNVLTWVIPT